MAGLYFHIPFCKRVCAYCDFYKSADLRRMDDLLAAMHRELDERRGYPGGETVTTRYFGGGTPSLCTPEAIRGLLDHAAQLFDCSGAEETTLEANPDDLTAEYLDGLLEAGIDRLSIGVQHISAYHLTVEPDTAFGRRAARGEFRAVDEQVSETEFITVHDVLTGAGFEHYEVSNFALPGFRARHNAAYWHGAKYLGIGPAAHSFDGEERHWNVSSVERYIAGDPAERELLTNRDRFNEYVMTALRTAEGIDTREVAARFGTKRLERMREEAAPYLQSGALRDAGGRLAVPPERFLISDAVIEALFET